MKSLRLASLVLIPLAIALAGCSKNPPPPAPTHVDAAVVDSKEIADRSIQTNCGVCHTLDMIRSQRLTRTQWEKELKKMTGWGAQIPPEEMPLMLDRLVEEQSVDSPPYAFASIAATDIPAMVASDPTPLPPDADVTRGRATYLGACQGCHGAVGKGGVGPNLLERPVLFRAQDFHKIVREGQKKMPGFASNLDAHAIDDLRAYLQSRHD